MAVDNLHEIGDNSNYPRVLIMSHDPICNTGWGKGKKILFKNWPIDKLAQFYITNDIPDNYDVCANYFHMTDSNIFVSNLQFTTASCNIYTDKNVATESVQSSSKPSILARAFHLIKADKSGIAELVRNVAWRKSKWQSPELINWLDEYKPQVVFCFSSSMPFFQKIVNWICTKYDIPLFIYFADHYLQCKNIISPVSWLNHFRYMKLLRANMRHVRKCYALSQGMMDEYSKRFNLNNYTILANGVDEDLDLEPEDFSRDPLKLLYLGGLYSNRWRTLVCLIDCLIELNKQGLRAELDIYSFKPPPSKVIEKLNTPNISSYKGFLKQEDFFEEISKSNALIHADSFRKSDASTYRYSISQKVYDYMKCNRLILAIGPESVETMKYLKKNEVALCICSTDKSEIIVSLKELLFNADYRQHTAEKAKEFAHDNHDMQKISGELFRDLCELS